MLSLSLSALRGPAAAPASLGSKIFISGLPSSGSPVLSACLACFACFARLPFIAYLPQTKRTGTKEGRSERGNTDITSASVAGSKTSGYPITSSRVGVGVWRSRSVGG